MIRAVKGTYDLYGSKLHAHRYIIDTARKVLESAGALEIQTPVFEETRVFEKGVGASTDIVRKEMYSFTDRGGRHLTLRPEGTAGIVRAYLEHGMKVWPSPVKLWMAGPMFRAENVQRGRQRQFHQVDFEALGLEDPIVDAEAIALMVEVLRALGLTGLEVKLGSVGDPEDRERYNAYLREVLEPYRSELSEDSQERLELNPMRIVDSKSAQDQEVLRRAGVRPMLEFLGEAARAHFEAVKRHLDRLGVPYTVDPTIVRGLDYYVRTAFEIHHARIGAQSALGGGGRYDGLSELLGGPRVPGVGWAFGVERIALALEEEGLTPPRPSGPDLYLVPLDEAAVAEALELATRLRPQARVEFAYAPRRVTKGIKEAEKRGARFVGLIGEGERARGVVAVKDLASGVQVEVPPSEVLSVIRGGTR
ncbi:histidine--tRNA ligase [Marinithermus hydrothermalis]|uniref:Histidine--tRNA ligase n=1 Tax=Marinithermus hydrothermalis (strain DSM 14884 / JCM 11576 / T1) TaxID=869210 RepID=F2NQM2_MARHT|nr:histidine--tRNA ligase [Marinithermus hydrothermalis]AEB11960.1 Histidyl-tRNA synthetase [Marinithermus hydrothermalis DSM 14884]